MILLLLGCSFSTTEHTSCTADAVCRDAFGWGATCDDAGWCVTPTLDAGCMALGEDPLGDTEPAVTLLALDGSGANGEVGRAVALVQAERPSLGDHTVHAAVCGDAESMEAASRQSGASVFVGARADGEARALVTLAQSHDAVVVSPAARDDGLSFVDGLDTAAPGRFWRTVGAHRTEGMAISSALAAEIDPTSSVLLVHADSGGGDEIADSFATEWGAQAGARLYYAPWEGDAVAEAITDRSVGVPAAIVIAANDTAEVVEALATIGADMSLDDVGVWTVSAAYDAALFTDLDDAGRSVLPRLKGVGYSAPDPSGSFGTRWATAYGAPPTTVEAFAYDAAWVAVYGLYGAGDDAGSGSVVAEVLGHLSAGDEAEVGPDGWTTGSAAITQGDVDLDGVTGPIDFDAWGDTDGRLTYWRIGSDLASFVDEGQWP